MSGLWIVDYLEHDGTVASSVPPENLHFLLELGVEGPGQMDHEISLHSRDEDGARVVRPGFIVPKGHDFHLRRADLSHPILGGIVTSYGGPEAGTEHVLVEGKGWLHYLDEGCKWPYDATLSYINWPDGFRFRVAAAEIGQIVKDILETVRDLSQNYPGPPTDAEPSYRLDFTVDVDNTGKTTNYEIPAFESQSIYELIRTLAQAEKANGGFDFLMTWDRRFRLIYPEIGDPDNPVLDLEVDVETALANMLSVAQTNTGPEATHVLGIGAGTSTRQGGVNKHFRRNSSIFRRWDSIVDFGDVKNLDRLEAMTSSKLSFGAYSVHEVPVTVDPKDHPGFWNRVRPGQYANVTYDLGYARLPNQVNLPLRIVSMDCNVDNNGNETVALGFNQHFDLSDFAGVDNW